VAKHSTRLKLSNVICWHQSYATLQYCLHILLTDNDSLFVIKGSNDVHNQLHSSVKIDEPERIEDRKVNMTGSQLDILQYCHLLLLRPVVKTAIVRLLFLRCLPQSPQTSGKIIIITNVDHKLFMRPRVGGQRPETTWFVLS
jgi:hypothetical protein